MSYWAKNGSFDFVNLRFFIKLAFIYSVNSSRKTISWGVYLHRKSSGEEILSSLHLFDTRWMVPRNVHSNTTQILFLKSELANKAEIYILSARDTTRAWVPGRGIMGNDVRVYKTMYNTWLSSRLQNQPRSLARLIFLCLVLSFLGTMHSVW